MKHLFNSVLFLHQNGVAHLDIKPANILIKFNLPINGETNSDQITQNNTSHNCDPMNSLLKKFGNTLALLCDFNQSITITPFEQCNNGFDNIKSHGTTGYVYSSWFGKDKLFYTQNQTKVQIPVSYHSDYFSMAIVCIDLIRGIQTSSYRHPESTVPFENGNYMNALFDLFQEYQTQYESLFDFLFQFNFKQYEVTKNIIIFKPAWLNQQEIVKQTFYESNNPKYICLRQLLRHATLPPARYHEWLKHFDVQFCFLSKT
jgi:serine/threonine protein kinase